MEKIIIKKALDVQPKHKKEHEDYEYYKRELVPVRKDGQCIVSLYEIPPKKAAYPYHYHMKSEEVFYILKGKGLLKTPNGERIVTEGDYIFFPANENGAHKLINASDKDYLIYLDFDTYNDIDIAFYPDSEKIGVFGKNINQLYKIKDQVEYYDGE